MYRQIDNPKWTLDAAEAQVHSHKTHAIVNLQRISS